MPRGRASNTVKIAIHEIHFSGFELPMEHEKAILGATSIKEIKTVPVEYHVIKTFNQRKGKVEYKAILPLSQRHELRKNFDKLRKLLEEAGADYGFHDDRRTLYLVLPVPDNSELIDFINTVEKKVAEFERISANDVFHVGVARDEIYIDKTSNAPITVKRSHIPGDSGFVAFVLNNFDMPKLWFKVYETAVILGDYDTFTLRFLHVERRKELVESNRVIVAYSIPDPSNPVGEFIKLRIEDDIEKLKEFDDFYRKMTLLWVERAVDRYTPELKAEVMDVIESVLNKKALKVVTAKEYSDKFYVDVITPDGKLHSEDFIPNFVLKKIVKTYYDSLLFQLLRVYLNEVRELTAYRPDIIEPEEKKKGFLDKLLKGLKKADKKGDEKLRPPEGPPEDESEAFIDLSLDYVKKD